MDKIRTRLLQSLNKLGAGYAPRGANLKTRLDTVHSKIEAYPKAEREAMAALFDTLCETNPNKAAGATWYAALEEWREAITGEIAEGKSAGMSPDELAAMIAAGKEEEKAESLEDQAAAAHAKVLAEKGLLPDEGETEEPDLDAEAEAAHAKVIADAS